MQAERQHSANLRARMALTVLQAGTHLILPATPTRNSPNEFVISLIQKLQSYGGEFFLH